MTRPRVYPLIFIMCVIAFLSLFISVAAPAQLWPSVKTSNWIPGTTQNIDWIATHYDWIDSATTPLS